MSERISFWGGPATVCGLAFLLSGVDASAFAAGPKSSAAQTSTPIRIDISTLSPTVLNCNVCRMRLGLPPVPHGGPLDVAAHDAKAARPTNRSELPKPKNQPSKSTPTAPTEKSSSLSPPLKQFSGAEQAAAVAGENAADRQIVDQRNLAANPPVASLATLQIEVDLLKRQLAERNTIIEQFNRRQNEAQERISELAAANAQLQKALAEATSRLEQKENELRKSVAIAESERQKAIAAATASQRAASVAADDTDWAKEKKKLTDQHAAELLKLLDEQQALIERANAYRQQRDGLQRQLDQAAKSNAAGDPPDPAVSTDQTSPTDRTDRTDRTDPTDKADPTDPDQPKVLDL